MRVVIALIQCLLIHCCLGNNNNGKVQCVGCDNEEDPHKPIYKVMAEETLWKYLETNKYERLYTVLQVQRVRVQPVQGKITKINFVAGATNCILDNQMNPVNPPCVIIYPVEMLECYSEIYEMAWINFRQITVTCNPLKNRS
ncbi:kininogen-1-like [Vanessa cardui]|uniref:kininogen-1-like n=1 Tax=Vanessa cardui TaxID=171605 RepID=UPI001F1442FF|nr:kininogen-1-like isoform X4 [Vanessa cardui]XP_046971685.1 kininogen-1-like [Vanessa cardui]